MDHALLLTLIKVIGEKSTRNNISIQKRRISCKISCLGKTQRFHVTFLVSSQFGKLLNYVKPADRQCILIDTQSMGAVLGMMENSGIDLTKRHDSLHTVNIKYGYILLGLSVFLILIRTSTLWFYQSAWRRSGRSTSYLRLINFPTALTTSIIVLTVAILCSIHSHFEKLSVLIKRTGRLAYALVPLDIFLAAEPAWFSIDNYLNTLQLHKWVSRIIVLLGIIHSIGFLIWYAVHNTFFKLFRPVNLIGFIIFIMGIIMMIFWKPVRNFNYKIFYFYHNFFLISFVFVIFLHARPGVGFLWLLNVTLLVLQFAKKYYYAKEITMSEIIENPGSDYIIIKFPKRLLPENYLPASHVRIGYSKWSPFFLALPSHPYTVATTYEDRDLLSSLVVKKTKFVIEPFETYSIQPIFNSSLSENFFKTADNINIVCGGSGISFGLGIFEYFKRSIVADGKDIKLKFIWITRNEEDLFILKELNVQGVDIFISKKETDELTTVQGEFNLDSGIPLQDLSTTSSDSLTTYEQKFENIAAIGRRPDLQTLLQGNLNKTIDYANKWILACGPLPLIRDCEKIATEEKCRFFSEEYSF